MRFYRWLCLVLCVALLAGCAPTVEPNEPKEPSEPQEPSEPEEPSEAQPENSFSPTSRYAGTPLRSGELPEAASAGNGISYFVILTEDNARLPFSVACHVSKTSVTAMLPSGVELDRVVVRFEATSQIYLDEQLLESGCVLDLREPLVLSARTSSGKVYTVGLNVQTLRTGLPSVALTVEGFEDITSKEEYKRAEFYVGGGDGAVCPYATELIALTGAQVKGRGNSSWAYEKKSFTVKLDEKLNLLGLGRSRHWTLVSNHQDKSLMRNEIAAYLSDTFGLVTMNTRSVDLWLNGEYWGTYMLIEKVEVESGRVDIPEYDEVSDPLDVGFLLEWDGHVSEVKAAQKAQWQSVGLATYDPVADIYFFDMNGRYAVLKEPGADEITPEQLAAAEQLLYRVDEAITSRDYAHIEQLIDVRSFAAWYLVEEIMKNMDSRFWSSCYMYSDGEGVLRMGPTWDFDMSLGNANYGGIEDPTGDYLADCKWYRDLLKIPEFCTLVAELLEEHAAALDAIPDYMDGYARMLDRSQRYNFERWDVLGVAVGWNPQSIVEASTYEKQLTLMKNYYRTRLSFVRTSLAQRCDPAEDVGLPDGLLPALTKGTAIITEPMRVEDGRSLKLSAKFDPALDLSDYAEDGVVCLTYYISSLSSLTSGHQLELTSAGRSDHGEFSWSLDPAEQMVAGSWQRLYLPLSEANVLERDVKADLGNINFFRIYVHVSEVGQLYVADLRILHEYELE